LHILQAVDILCIYLWTWLSLPIKSDGSSLYISSIILCVTVTCVYCAVPLLGAFAKLQKVTIGFVMSIFLSIHMEQLGFHWMDFHEI